MKRLKIKKYHGIEVNYNSYIVDFVQEAGETYAIAVEQDNTIQKYNIKSIEIDYRHFNEHGECY